jgi:hypothetical protein
MELILGVLGHPFTWGLLVGLIFAAWAFFGGWSARRALKREIRRLEDHCRTAADLNARGQQALMDENATLKGQNENLRISLAELKNKPDRAEIQKLYLFDKAVHLMTARAPGFATAWESVLQEAQAEIDKTSTGILPFMRRIIHPFSSPHPAALPEPTPQKSED